MSPSILSNKKIQEKYIRVCEGSLRVKLERGETVVIEHFPIRKYLSFDLALKAAIEWRDRRHLELFGYEVPDKIIHIAPRKFRKRHTNPENGELLPELPAGVSYGFHSGVLRYVVVSHRKYEKTIRTRFSVLSLGLGKAIEEAIKYRNALFPGA